MNESLEKTFEELNGIEEISKAPCKHHEVIIDQGKENFIVSKKTGTCEDCGAKLKAVWQVVDEQTKAEGEWT